MNENQKNLYNLNKAIKEINKNATYFATSIDNIEWKYGTSPIPKNKIQAKIDNIENQNYISKRRSAYPEIGDQLDMLWHSIDEDPALKQKYFKFYEAIKAVKAKYPK